MFVTRTSAVVPDTGVTYLTEAERDAARAIGPHIMLATTARGLAQVQGGAAADDPGSFLWANMADESLFLTKGPRHPVLESAGKYLRFGYGGNLGYPNTSGYVDHESDNFAVPMTGSYTLAWAARLPSSVTPSGGSVFGQRTDGPPSYAGFDFSGNLVVQHQGAQVAADSTGFHDGLIHRFIISYHVPSGELALIRDDGAAAIATGVSTPWGNGRMRIGAVGDTTNALWLIGDLGAAFAIGGRALHRSDEASALEDLKAWMALEAGRMA